MLVSEARDIARQWVATEAAARPGFVGAFITGSTLWLPDDAVLPPTSDVDVMVVLDRPDAPPKLGKFSQGGALVEVTYVSASAVQSAEQVLGHYHLASSFSRPNVLLDPTGHLTAIREVVAREFPRRDRVRQRCEHVASNIDRFLGGIGAARTLHEQAMSWTFGVGGTTHLLLVAGLRNPTVRTRYLAVRELLASYGRLGAYARLLDLLGCGRLTQARVSEHLTALAGAFDAASATIRSPYFFATDLSADARPVAIGGSRDLIDQGNHREAVFWMLVTYTRCLMVFHQDAPELTERYLPGLWSLLNDVGIASEADLQRRCEQVHAFLPEVWAVADEIMAVNPEIEE